MYHEQCWKTPNCEDGANKAVRKLKSKQVDLKFPNLENPRKLKVISYSDATYASLAVQVSIESDQFRVTREIDKSQFLKLHDNFVWTEEGATKFSSLSES